jgi:adenosylhomocysteine nucleosidase
MTLVLVVGLAREARIVQGPGIVISRRGRDLDLLIAKGASGIVSIGIAAALDPQLEIGDCVIATAVAAGNDLVDVDRRWSQSIMASLSSRFRHGPPASRPSAGTSPVSGTLDRRVKPGHNVAKQGIIAGGNGVLAFAQDKARLRDQTGGMAADMESHIAACAARAANIPFAALRVISDRASDALPPAAVTAMRADGSIDVGAVIVSLIAKPQQIGGLIETACAAETAFVQLLRCRRLLGPGLACPYLGELLSDMR